MKKNKEQVFISALVYVRNCEACLADSLQQLWDMLEDNYKDFELILVDDASHDASADKVRAFARSKEQKRVTLISLTSKHGVERAMQVAIDFSIGDFVLEIDDIDMGYDVSALKSLYDKSCEGYDIVSLQPKQGASLGSSCFYRLLNCQHEVNLNLGTQVAHCLTRRALNAISRFKDKTSYRKIHHSLGGYKQTSIPVTLSKKVESSYSLGERVNMAGDILFYFTNIGMKLCVYIAVLFFMIALLGGAYAVYFYCKSALVVQGWTTLMLFMSFGFSGIFMVLAILGKYLSLTLREMSSAPRYTVKSIEKI